MTLQREAVSRSIHGISPPKDAVSYFIRGISQEIEAVSHIIHRQTPSIASFESTLQRIHHEKEAISRPILGMNRETEAV